MSTFHVFGSEIRIKNAISKMKRRIRCLQSLLDVMLNKPKNHSQTHLTRSKINPWKVCMEDSVLETILETCYEIMSYLVQEAVLNGNSLFFKEFWRADVGVLNDSVDATTSSVGQSTSWSHTIVKVLHTHQNCVLS